MGRVVINGSCGRLKKRSESGGGEEEEKKKKKVVLVGGGKGDGCVMNLDGVKAAPGSIPSGQVSSGCTVL